MSGDLRLAHDSAKPLTEIKHADGQPPASDIPSKPHGLWLSVDGPDDWKAWCEAESFSLGCLVYRTPIVIDSEANILHLTSVRDIDEFSAQYGKQYYWRTEPKERREDFVDWQRVADDYQGIIIAPYQWERRLNGRARWYYGWDCASGCVWNARAIRIGELSLKAALADQE